jgi:hypothetical protein
VPPTEELTVLYEAVHAGRDQHAREHIARLARADEAYRPFVERMQGLLRSFDLDQMADMLGELIAERGHAEI